jgi:hypothetical protein
MIKQGAEPTQKTKSVAGSVTAGAKQSHPAVPLQRSTVETESTISNLKTFDETPVFKVPVSPVQLVKPGNALNNTYKEVEKNDHSNIHVDHLGHDDRDLIYQNPTSYGKVKAGKTWETGATVFDLDTVSGEKDTDWLINPHILQWGFSNTKLGAIQGFTLPVSCIESTEHIMHHSKNSKKIPDYPDKSKKSVSLGFQNAKNSTNEVVADVSSDDVSTIDYKKYTSFDFSKAPLGLNEGMLVIDPGNPTASLHAVVVVGVNTKTGQVIVVERNAGTTTGDNIYVDKNWLLNAYDSPAAFLSSMNNKKMIIGKLVAN